MNRRDGIHLGPASAPAGPPDRPGMFLCSGRSAGQSDGQPDRGPGRPGAGVLSAGLSLRRSGRGDPGPVLAHAVGAGALLDRAVHPGGHRAGGGRDSGPFFGARISILLFRGRLLPDLRSGGIGERVFLVWSAGPPVGPGAVSGGMPVPGGGRTPCCAGCWGTAGRRLPQGSAYWGKLALYGLGLVVCVTLECMAAPGAAEGRRPVCVVNASVWEKELSACRSYWTCLRSI